MGDIQIKKKPKNYDAVIVGSGAGGGMAAYVLSKAGLWRQEQAVWGAAADWHRHM